MSRPRSGSTPKKLSKRAALAQVRGEWRRRRLAAGAGVPQGLPGAGTAAALVRAAADASVIERPTPAQVRAARKVLRGSPAGTRVPVFGAGEVVKTSIDVARERLRSARQRRGVPGELAELRRLLWAALRHVDALKEANGSQSTTNKHLAYRAGQFSDVVHEVAAALYWLGTSKQVHPLVMRALHTEIRNVMAGNGDDRRETPQREHAR